MLVIGVTIVLAIVIVIAMDIYLARTKGFEGTLSWWIYVNSCSYPIIPAAIGFIIGLLFGHLFWDQGLIVSLACPKT
jgi:hypothetical protein